MAGPAQNYQLFTQRGDCECGKNVTEHVTDHNDLKLLDSIDCKLTQVQVEKWMTGPYIAAQTQQRR
jgi:hypothetical protein